MTGTGSTTYTGYITRGSNKLRIYSTATGYDSSYWLDPLQNANKCGFNIEYIDAGHSDTIVTYSDSTTSSFNIVGELDSSSITNIYDAVSVDIGNTVTSIGYGTFGYSNALTSVIMPSSVTIIGPGAFSYCDNLASIKIPSSVTTIYVSTFRNCSNMSTATFEDKTMS